LDCYNYIPQLPWCYPCLPLLMTITQTYDIENIVNNVNITTARFENKLMQLGSNILAWCIDLWWTVGEYRDVILWRDHWGKPSINTPFLSNALEKMSNWILFWLKSLLWLLFCLDVLICFDCVGLFFIINILVEYWHFETGRNSKVRPNKPPYWERQQSNHDTFH
jgi:hypothetical protein